MELETLRLDVDDDGVAVVTMDRPPVNAQNRRLREEMVAVFDSLSARDDVRVAVLTGAGRTFSAGADITERQDLVDRPGAYLAHNRLTRESFYAMSDCTVPVIAAINGPAVGAGYALAAMCDILVAAEDAWIQMPELDRGLLGGAKFLSAHFGRSRSRLLFFTGRRIDAAEMWRLGVVDDVSPSGGLMSTATGIAREIAAKSPQAVSRAKAAFTAVEEMPFRDGYRYEQTQTHQLSASEDAREAREAFLEKRPPRFTGR